MTHTQSLSANAKLIQSLDFFASSDFVRANPLAGSARVYWDSQLKVQGKAPAWLAERERAEKVVATHLEKLFPCDEVLSGAKPSAKLPVLKTCFLGDEQKTIKTIHNAYVSYCQVRHCYSSTGDAAPIYPDQIDVKYAQVIAGKLFKLKWSPKR